MFNCLLWFALICTYHNIKVTVYLKCVDGTNYYKQAGINTFKTVLWYIVIQLFVLACFYCRTTTVLWYVVHNRVMFSKKHDTKNQTNKMCNPCNCNTSNKVTNQLKYLGAVEVNLSYYFIRRFIELFSTFLR